MQPATILNMLYFYDPAGVVSAPAFGADHDHAEVRASCCDPEERGVKPAFIPAVPALPEFVTDGHMVNLFRNRHTGLLAGEDKKGCSKENRKRSDIRKRKGRMPGHS